MSKIGFLAHFGLMSLVFPIRMKLLPLDLAVRVGRQ